MLVYVVVNVWRVGVGYVFFFCVISFVFFYVVVYVFMLNFIFEMLIWLLFNVDYERYEI